MEFSRQEYWSGLRMKGGIKRRETDPASNKFSKCSPQPGTHKEIQSWVERKGGGGDRGDLVEKKRVKRGREQSGQ